MIMPRHHLSHSSTHAFTLIELSVVLVIIGLIVGGILTGRDLIASAAIRSQISQIERLQAATHTFVGKYGYLPGDMPVEVSTRFKFPERIYSTDHGNGNGFIEIGGMGSGVFGFETSLFWSDLAFSRLVEGSYKIVDGYQNNNDSAFIYYPRAAFGSDNSIAAWCCGVTDGDPSSRGVGYDNFNYFSIQHGSQLNSTSTPYMSVKSTYDLDKKVDDGLPQSGRVIAAYRWSAFPGCCISVAWAGTNTTSPTNSQPTTAATPATSSTCYDNGNASGAVQQYSLSQNNGAGVNCGLSFKLQ